MSKSVKIRKGMNIRVKGAADKVVVDAPTSATYSIKPPDFHGLIPKMVKKVGESVKAGEPIFFDKYNDAIKYVSPVSGTLKDIIRGAKRRILEVVVESDGKFESLQTNIGDVASMSRDDVKAMLLNNGLWPFIKMRPLDVVANQNDTPKSIFISGFDSSPLAPDYDFIVHGQDGAFQAGLEVLSKLTDGKINLQTRNSGTDAAFTNAKNVVINKFSGPHPAGNVGTQIHHIDPLNKGEVIWTVNPQDVLIIGRFALSGKYDATKLVALTGPGIKNPKYFRTILGASIASLVEGNIDTDNVRIVSGNVLTGDKVETQGYLGFYHNQITALKEGNKYKFFLTEGWLSLGFKRLSNSEAYPSKLMGPKFFDVDTNLNGEERAFVVTEQYEKVFPFDIYPVQLLKSIIVNDIDMMEKLGIYEVAPEDFALCEFVCTSKIESQDIVRKGLDVIQTECM